MSKDLIKALKVLNTRPIVEIKVQESLLTNST